VVDAPEVLMEGIAFGESPRWHDRRVWFSDWGAHQVIALDPGGSHEVVATVASFPMCIDFLPDGRLLVEDSAQRRLLRREPGGSLAGAGSGGPGVAPSAKPRAAFSRRRAFVR
jgi:sugar lactone lactonase YvrE